MEYRITDIGKIMRRLDIAQDVTGGARRPGGDGGDQGVAAGHKKADRVPEIVGITTTVVDESIFTNDPEGGVKYWSSRCVPIITAYNGSHNKIVAYGALTMDGRQFVRTYEGSDKEAFLKYLKALVSHFGRIAVIMDNAPQHKARMVLKYLKEPNARIIWLPRATPELSVVGEYWH